MVCFQCGREFTPVIKRKQIQKFCAPDCRAKYHKLEISQKTAAPGVRLAPGTIGAMSELVVCNDLMFHGFHVYRALSPNAWADLVAFRLNDPKPYLIEVRTGLKYKTGNISYAKHRRKDAGKEHYAVVVWEDGKPELFYYPEIRFNADPENVRSTRADRRGASRCPLATGALITPPVASADFTTENVNYSSIRPLNVPDGTVWTA